MLTADQVLAGRSSSGWTRPSAGSAGGPTTAREALRSVVAMNTHLHRLSPREVASLTTTARPRTESVTVGVLAAASALAVVAAGLAALLR